MSRPRGYGAQEARNAWRRELEHCMLDLEIRSKTELAARAGVAPRTMYRKFEDVSGMDIGDLSVLKEILCPNPLVLLRAIGYSQKEIDRAVAAGGQSRR